MWYSIGRAREIVENLPLGALNGRPLAGPFVCRRVSFKTQIKPNFAAKKAKKNFKEEERL